MNLGDWNRGGRKSVFIAASKCNSEGQSNVVGINTFARDFHSIFHGFILNISSRLGHLAGRETRRIVNE